MSEDYIAEVVGGEESSVTPEETPSEPIAEPTPATEEVPTEEQPQTEEPTDELLELPDGRKVDAQTVLNEYKNLYSDYTRKSQELSNYKKPQETITKTTDAVDYRSPEWEPKSYAEIIEAAKIEIQRDLESRQQAEVEAERQLSAQIDEQLSEVKKIDPKVNESKLFEHATKYGMPNLVNAYHNMREMNKAIELTRQKTAQEIQKRNADPVATTPGQTMQIDDEDVYDPGVRTTSLVDYLRQLKK